jgi:hypothetical protein
MIHHDTTSTLPVGPEVLSSSRSRRSPEATSTPFARLDRRVAQHEPDWAAEQVRGLRDRHKLPLMLAHRWPIPSGLLGVAGLLAAACRSSGGNPSCDPDLSDYRTATYQPPSQAPPLPVVPLDPPTGNVWTIQVDFPPEARSGGGAITYWLAGDENVVADVQLARGTGVAGDPWDVALIAVIDGQQVPVMNADMQPLSTLRYRIAAGQVVRDRLTLPGNMLREGAQSAAFLPMGPKGERIPRWSFTILKNGTEFAPREAADAARAPAIPNRAPEAIITGGTDIFSGRATLSPGGRLPVTFIIQVPGDCPMLPRSRRIIAALDGVQIPVGGLGLAPWVSLTPADRLELTTEITGLPDDGQLHALAIWLISDGEYMEVPLGKSAPLDRFPELIGRAWWGPD